MNDTSKSLFDVPTPNIAREKLYKDLGNKSRLTHLDRVKETIINLSDEDRKAFDRWNIDRQMDEADAIKAQTKLDTAGEYLTEALELKNNMGKMNGISSGYYDIDQMTMGFAKGELTIVAGETSQGKTLLCVNMASKMLKNGHTVAFLTLEMTKPELVSRFWTIMGDDAFDNCFDKLLLQKAHSLNWRAVPQIIKNAKDSGASIVIIDHLHYFSRNFSNTAEELGAVTQEFKQAAIKYEIPVILISHTRKLEKFQKEAGINDLRGSSYIAQDSDIVLMVSQPRGDDDERRADKIQVKLLKNRNRLCYRIGAFVIHDKQGLNILPVTMQNGQYPCDQWRAPWLAKPAMYQKPPENPNISHLPVNEMPDEQKLFK